MSTEIQTHADPIDEQNPDRRPDGSPAATLDQHLELALVEPSLVETLPVDSSPVELGATVHATRSSPADRGITGRGTEVACEQ